jgi:hypothetical protein
VFGVISIFIGSCGELKRHNDSAKFWTLTIEKGSFILGDRWSQQES